MAQRTPTNWLSQAMSAGEVKRRSVHGVVASTLRRFGNQAIGLISLVFIARLLTPSDSGLIVLVSVATGFVGIFAELQLSAVTVKFQNLSQTQASNLFWIRLATNAAAAGLVAASAPLFASFYADPRVAPVTMVLAAGMLLGALGAQHAALLRRNLRIGEQARVDICSAAITATVSIWGAFQGWAYWALVAGAMTGSITRVLQLWSLCDWRPSAPDWQTDMRPMVVHGMRLSVFAIFANLAGNISNLIIGRSWGAAATGHYARAINLNGLMLGSVWEPLDAVAGPALAKLFAQPERMTAFYYKASALLVMGAIPVAFVGMVLPHELVRVLLGPQWDRSAEILFWLSLGVLPTVVSHTASWVFFSVGDARAVMRWGIFGWSGMIVGTLVGAAFSPEGIAIAISVTTALLTVPCLRTAFRNTPLCLAPLCRVLARPVAAGLLAGLAAWPLLTLTPQISALGRLVLGGGVFMLVYGALLLTIFGQRELLREILGQLRARGATVAASGAT
jgi:PST family polysaccharide transporter